MNSLKLKLEQLRQAVNQKNSSFAAEAVRELKPVVAKFPSFNPSKSAVDPNEIQFASNRSNARRIY
jgi:hypothetical protein